MDLVVLRTQLLPASVEIAASLSHQLTRWLIEAGAEPVNEGDCADVQGG